VLPTGSRPSCDQAPGNLGHRQHLGDFALDTLDRGGGVFFAAQMPGPGHGVEVGHAGLGHGGHVGEGGQPARAGHGQRTQLAGRAYCIELTGWSKIMETWPASRSVIAWPVPL
jgi:hypothetical protein